MTNITRRDYFAAHCPDSWIKETVPKTFGGIRDELIKNGTIPKDRASRDVCRSYSEAEYHTLIIKAKWDYADLMIKMGGDNVISG